MTSQTTPGAFIAAFEGQALQRTTPCGEGEMVWRCWPARSERKQRPAILLHGGSGSWLHWIRNIGPLSADRDVWAPDIPGFGGSARPPDPVGFATIAHIIADGVRQLMPVDERLDLVGFSFGSHTMQYVAAELGDRVGTSVLVTAHMLGPLRAAPSQILERWRDVKDVAVREGILKRNLGALMLAHEASMDALALHIYAGDVVRARIRPAKFIDDRDFAMIERLPCRVAGIAGALDPLGVPSPSAQGDELLKARPDARFHLVENAGHWVAYEAADEVNRVLRDMLDT